MDTSVLRYTPPALLIMSLMGSIYLLYGFVSSGVFSSQTVTFLASGTLMIFTALIISFPRVESWFVSKLSENTFLYWSIILVLLLIALMLFQQGIASGGVDYANYMAQNASG